MQYTALSSTLPNKVYKFVEYQNYSIQTPFTGIHFFNELLQIQTNGTITVLCSNLTNGYAWDGCSPKANWLDITWGTPDGRLDCATQKPKTYYASLVHEVLYQYHGLHGLSRKQCDRVFYQLLQHAHFQLAYPYYTAVRIFGGFAGNWKGKDRWW